MLLTEAAPELSAASGPGGYGDHDQAASSEEDQADRERMIALVEDL